VDKSHALRGNEHRGIGDKVARIADLAGISDGGIEGGAVAHRRLGRQIEKLGQGEGSAGDVLRQGNARFVIGTVYADLVGHWKSSEFFACTGCPYLACQIRDHNPGQHEEAGIFGQPLEITFPRGAIPAEESVAVSAFPRNRAEQRARHWTAVPVADQIPQVLAHRIAVAEVVIAVEQTVDSCRSSDPGVKTLTASGRRSRSA
jgi:hypothetical protein